MRRLAPVLAAGALALAMAPAAGATSLPDRTFRVSLAPREASGCWFVVMSAMVARASNVGGA